MLAASTDIEPVAPGVTRATYRLATSAGPLVVEAVAVDPRVPNVRLGAVLAHDTILSKDETVSSMARRTGAVAGINGDYFDIGGSGAPLGLLIAGGAIERAPSARVALVVGRDRAVRFESLRFRGDGDAAVRKPDHRRQRVAAAGRGLAAHRRLRDAAGRRRRRGRRAAAVQPDPSGLPRYRVSAVATEAPYPAGPAVRLAFGPAARAAGPIPDVGDVVSLNADTDPALGGDRRPPSAAVRSWSTMEPPSTIRSRRTPASAPGGSRPPPPRCFRTERSLLVVVDGRRPSVSIGVDRDELAALLRGFGATSGMAFDGGGSATLVARVLGDETPSVVNDPSDGIERPVADGLFVYSDAPLGPPVRLVVRPAPLVALAGARVRLHARLVDAADHGLGDARGPWQLEAPRRARRDRR